MTVRRHEHPLDQTQALTQRLREAMQMQRRRRTARASTWRPPLDLQATADAYLVSLDLPGVRREDIEVTAEQGVLFVRGEVGLPERRADAQRVRGERSLGPFARSVRLPSDADMSEITATLTDGVLRICAGRRPQAGRIDIQIGQ